MKSLRIMRNKAVAVTVNSRPKCRLFSPLGLVIASSTLLLAACSPSGPVQLSGPIMGTQYIVTLECDSVKKKPAEWRKLVLAEMDSVNQSMSTYIGDSELSQINKSTESDWQKPSTDFMKVLGISEQVYFKSGGAFDPTVSPLVDLWGFGAGSKKQLKREIPTAEQLKLISKRVGFDKVELDRHSQKWRKRSTDIQLDLSAVAKGYAVDKVSNALKANGCDNHLVYIGGELKASGKKANNSRWRVAVEKPLLNGEKQKKNAVNFQQLIELENLGLASSGDYRNYYEQDNKRYSHTIDPRTLSPIDHNLASVTVIHAETAVADAWATALMVMGEEGVETAKNVGLAAYFIFRDEKKEALSFITISTKQFDKYRFPK